MTHPDEDWAEQITAPGLLIALLVIGVTDLWREGLDCLDLGFKKGLGVLSDTNVMVAR